MPAAHLQVSNQTAGALAADVLRLGLELERLDHTDPATTTTRRALISRLTDTLDTTQRVYGPAGLLTVIAGVAAYTHPGPAPTGLEWTPQLVGEHAQLGASDPATVWAARLLAAVWNDDPAGLTRTWAAGSTQPWACVALYSLVRQVARATLAETQQITITPPDPEA